MNKETQSPETILERAGELFKRGNYLLALHEFEKAAAVVQRDDIIDRIKICKEEIEKHRLKDLIKRGKKHAGKKNYRKAVRCFEEAYAISGEDWLKERIDQLKEHLCHRDSFREAKDAEAAGEFEKAADLYGQALSSQIREDIIIKRACCLIRAGKNRDAAAAIKDLPSTLPGQYSDQSIMYDYGFVLAGVGRYYECLKVWDSIETNDSGFSEQKEYILELLETDLYERLNGSADYSRIFEQGKYLRDSAARDRAGDLVKYCKYARIDELWKEEQYEVIRELLLPYPEQLDSNLLALYAKTFFKLAEITSESLSDLAMFWLSAMYDHEISCKFSARSEARDEVRKILIRKAEELIKKHDNAGDLYAKKVLACWNVEKKLIEDLYASVGNHKDLSHLVRTPSFAEAFGLSSKILGMIQGNREYFSDREHYLSTGAYYSPAVKSLLHLERGEYEKALSSLPESSDSEFTDYCMERVMFEYGLYCLEKGKDNPERYFKTTASLFEKAPRYEQEFIDEAINHHEPDELRKYENILKAIHSKGSTKAIADALSLIMIRRSIVSYNMNQINPKILETTARKALKLNPENELAQGTLKDIRVDLEIEELFSAINKHAMDKACRIAVESEHQKVRESFFNFMNDIFQDIFKRGKDKEEKLLMLNNILKWCTRVDEFHPILDQILGKIQMLEQVGLG